jgi:hypothetical protein
MGFVGRHLGLGCLSVHLNPSAWFKGKISSHPHYESQCDTFHKQVVHFLVAAAWVDHQLTGTAGDVAGGVRVVVGDSCKVGRSSSSVGWAANESLISGVAGPLC